MCELNKDLNSRAENETMWRNVLEQYMNKNDDIHMRDDLVSFEDNDSIYSTEELYAPQELMAVVFLGTN